MADLRSICAFLAGNQSHEAFMPSNNTSSTAAASTNPAPLDLGAQFLVKIRANSELIQSMCLDLKEGGVDGPAKEITHSLVKFAYPLLLLFGLFGNALTFLVMCRVHKRKRNFQKFSLSLGTLALADIAILLLGCLVEYFEEILGINIRTWSEVSCKMTLFACYLFSCYSAYLHAFIAIERWNAISRPLASLTRFTFKTHRCIICAVFLLCIFINLPLFWVRAIEESVAVDNSSALGLKIVSECNYISISHEIIILMIDSVFNCLVPFVITTLFSILTLVKLIHIRASTSQKHDANSNVEVDPLRKTESHVLPTTAPPSSTNTGNFSPTRVHISGGSNKTNNRGSSFSQKIKVYKLTSASVSSHGSNKSNIKLTLMLMALPISYLVTAFPIFVIVICGIVDKQPGNPMANMQASNLVLFTLAKLLMYINNSINILFYIFFGKNLRKDFVALLLSPVKCMGLHAILPKRFAPRPNHRFQSLTNFDQQQDMNFAQNQAQFNSPRVSFPKRLS